MPATVLSTLHKLPHSVLTISVQGRYQYTQVIGEEIETEKMDKVPTAIQQISIRTEMKTSNRLQTSALHQYAITISLV